LERAKLRKASLGDLTTNKSQSFDGISRSEFDKRIEEMTDLLMQHFRELSNSNMEKLSEVVSRNSQQRAERDRASNELLKQLQNAKYEELQSSIRDLEQRITSRIDVLVEEIALTGRSFIEVKGEVHRLSETEGSLLRELNAKQEYRMETAANSEGGIFGDIKISAIAEAPTGNELLQHLNDRIRAVEE